MKVDDFFEIIGSEFYTGVPDSQLKALCDYLIYKYGTDPKHHVIAANEGNATALAAGYHLATGRVPVVYMQNSGEGNVINPVASLLSDEVYGIPCIFVIGWRGEPGVHDEPQHIYQGKVTCKLLEVMDIEYQILGKDTTEDELKSWMVRFHDRLNAGKSVAIVVRKGALSFDEKVKYKNGFALSREEIIETIVKYTGDDPIVSTTGKASRELFEIRERCAGSAAGRSEVSDAGVPDDRKSDIVAGDIHGHDFLTVGSMGHASSIALGIALQKPDKRVWCIDGDGASLMHMGAMAVISDIKPKNLIHIVINNGAHETVGGQPTVLAGRNIAIFAGDLGYKKCYVAEDINELNKILTDIVKDECSEEDKTGRADDGPIFLEVKCAIGARADLGRPTTSPKENKEAFVKAISD